MSIDLDLKSKQEPYQGKNIEHKWYKWIKNNPNTIDYFFKSLIALGILSVIPAIKARRVTARNIAQLALGGGLASIGWKARVVFGVSLQIKEMISTSKPALLERGKEQVKYVFEPRKEKYGELKYEGDLPVLIITTNDPFDAGYAHGKILAQQIMMMRDSYRSYKKLDKEKQCKLFSAINNFIPKQYLTEMQGIVEGCNSRLQQNQLAIEDLLFLHLLPENTHLDTMKMVGVAESRMPGTIIVDGNKTTGPLLARNLSWLSSGSIEDYSFVLRRGRTIEIAAPGFVGTFTGMNKEGLCVAMNVCEGVTDTVNGIPSVIYNRMCLENSRSVEDVKLFVDENNPIGAYHLTVADKLNSLTFHFDQGGSDFYTREWSRRAYQITTNRRYHSEGRGRPIFKSTELWEKRIEHYYNTTNLEISPLKRIQRVLSFKFSEQESNAQFVVMDPKNTEITVAFDCQGGGHFGPHSFSFVNKMA